MQLRDHIMNDYSAKYIRNMSPPIELDSNSGHGLQMLDNSYRQRSESRGSTISSASSSETSEEMELTSNELSNSLDPATKDNPNEEPDIRRFRSMSDGATSIQTSEEPFEVFPSLPNSVLEKMGLLGNGPRERLNEEELEQKFVALALAFTIDAATIKDRCERQRRYRDQTETNLTVEIERLIEKVNRIQPLCVDAETTELLTDLLAQVDIVMRASSHSSISAERFGAVQHEERLSQSVNLMINHVTLLKQQRDSARRHLQYTKRMLQDSNTSEQSTSKTKVCLTNGPAINRRRASIASFSQQPDLKPSTDFRRVTRRTSELSLRATALPRTVRPARLELGVDLVKIREGTAEGESNMPEEYKPTQENQPEVKSHKSEVIEPVTSQQNKKAVKINTDLSLKQRIMQRVKNFGKSTRSKYKNWSEDGSLHEIFCFATLMCFSFSIISLGNLYIELEYARGVNSYSYWNFDRLWSQFLLFVRQKYDDDIITS